MARPLGTPPAERRQATETCHFFYRHPGLDPGSIPSTLREWTPDQVRGDEWLQATDCGHWRERLSGAVPPTHKQTVSLQSAYCDLLNYEGLDATSPIDPMSYRTSDGDHLIHIASLRGDVETVRILLAAGEDVNAIGDMGNTPAHYAAMAKCQNLFDLLIANGADRDLENEFGAKAAFA